MEPTPRVRRGSAITVTGAAGAFIVAAVLGGVLVGCGGVPSDRSTQTVSPPAATPSSDPLPVPKTFDATAFTEATDGWISAWTEGRSPVSTDLPCVPSNGELPKPLDSTTREFRAGPRVGATHKVERFDTSQEANDSLLAKAYSESCEGEGSELPDEIWSGGQSVNFGHKLDGKSLYEFWVVHEAELAVLRVAGAADLPDRVRKQIVFALLADLRT